MEKAKSTGKLSITFFGEGSRHWRRMLGALDSQMERYSLSVLVVHAAISSAIARWVVVLRVAVAKTLGAASSLRAVTGLAVETCRGSMCQLMRCRNVLEITLKNVSLCNNHHCTSVTAAPENPTEWDVYTQLILPRHIPPPHSSIDILTRTCRIWIKELLNQDTDVISVKVNVITASLSQQRKKKKKSD